ncbi:hypothetical protein [Streptomyces sp. NPDC048577]|uniref:hypothetical protein n=1 Tax=Streptomyces sp. NPDC048577 TaxID=3157209 RepID=UPI00342523B6
MSTPVPQPARPGPAAPRRAGVTALGGAAAVAALVWAGAPWWAVAVAVGLAIVVPGLILFAQVVLPEDSEHKRDLWLAVLRSRDRRATRKVQRGEPAARERPWKRRSRRRAD